MQGPIHPELGIAMDMSIQLKSSTGAICTLSLSFNNDGPLGTFFRYICDNGTYIARYDDLFDGKEEKIDVSKVDVSMNGIELQDREFFAAIREGREPNASVAQVLPCYRTWTSSSGSSARRRDSARASKACRPRWPSSAPARPAYCSVTCWSQAGIDALIVERQSRAHMEGRIRAGVLEDTTTDLLVQARHRRAACRRKAYGTAGSNLTNGERLIHIDIESLHRADGHGVRPDRAHERPDRCRGRTRPSNRLGSRVPSP